MKKSFLLALRLLAVGISVFALSSINAFAQKEYLHDDSGKAVAKYDTDTREIDIFSDIPQKKWKKVLGYDGHCGVEKYYGFYPKKITYKNVVYEYSGSKNSGMLTIKSLGGGELFKKVIDMFGPRLYDTLYDRACQLEEVNIIGEQFKALPCKLFHACTLKRINIKQTSISSIDIWALGCCHELELLELPSTLSAESITASSMFGPEKGGGVFGNGSSHYAPYPLFLEEVKGNGKEILKQAHELEDTDIAFKKKLAQQVKFSQEHKKSERDCSIQ